MLLFFVALVSLSQAATFTRLAEAPALMIGFWRLLGASLLMLSFQSWLFLREPKNFQFQFSTHDSLWTAASGLFFFLHLWTFFIAAQTTSIANCMVVYSSSPLFTALGAWIMFKIPFEKRHFWAFTFGFIGIVIIGWDQIQLTQGIRGELSAIISAAFFSLYFLTGKKARENVPNTQFIFLVYAVAACLFFIVGQYQNVQLIGYPANTWIFILANIIFATLLGHALFTYLVKYLNINWMSCGKLLEPGMSAFVAALVFQEAVSLKTIVAFLFTATACLILLQPYLKSSAFNKPHS